MINHKLRAKKHLGQHFLNDLNIAEKIAYSLPHDGLEYVLEVGPGMGVLTQFLVGRFQNLKVVEIDSESVDYLRIKWPELSIIKGDFLKMPLELVFGIYSSVGVIGNFPYNISSQIVFYVIEARSSVAVCVGMFQKEMAERISAKNGNKSYGILSVLAQAFYDVEYLFTVSPKVFSPPPKVDSGVIRMVRKPNFRLSCNEELLFKVVKMGFHQRRKTLRNSLKAMNMSDALKESPTFDRRPEQLTVDEFVNLTNLIEGDGACTR